MNSPLLDKIHTRGYWEVIIRPNEFNKNRISNISNLFPLLEKSIVRIRGWSFPHIDINRAPHIDIDWIGQELEWNHFLSSWRFYQSGLFIHVSGLWVDWRDRSSYFPADQNWKPNVSLGVVDCLYFFNEVFELAARLSLSEAGGDTMYIGIKSCNIQKRRLYIDDDPTFGILNSYQASMKDYPYEIEVAKEVLMADPKELAFQACNELFKRFNWNTSVEVLKELFNRVRHR
jgi:hypothetical protein